MIIRDALRCSTCGTLHVIRIGMGQENRQDHRFPCRKCNEDIVIALVVDHGNADCQVLFQENATRAREEPGAEVVNLDANFLVPADMRAVDAAFPRFAHFDAMRKHVDQGRPRARRRPDYMAEWTLLRKAWSLHRNGGAELSRTCVERGSSLYYVENPLEGLPDWLWKFTGGLAGRRFDEPFVEATEFLKQFENTPRFEALREHYRTDMAPSRGIRYFTLLDDYFNAYSEFAQVQTTVNIPLETDSTCAVTSADFGRTKMFYGSTFETLSAMVDLLAFANNVVLGRNFDEFATLTVKKYYDLDNLARFGPFKNTPALAGLCLEAANQLRNASHHNNMTFDAATQIITYRVGKGGVGAVQTIPYTEYLKRCVTVFLQTVNVFRLELIIGQRDVGHALF